MHSEKTHPALQCLGKRHLSPNGSASATTAGRRLRKRNPGFTSPRTRPPSPFAPTRLRSHALSPWPPLSKPSTRRFAPTSTRITSARLVGFLPSFPCCSCSGEEGKKEEDILRMPAIGRLEQLRPAREWAFERMWSGNKDTGGLRWTFGM